MYIYYSCSCLFCIVFTIYPSFETTLKPSSIYRICHSVYLLLSPTRVFSMWSFNAPRQLTCRQHISLFFLLLKHCKNSFLQLIHTLPLTLLASTVWDAFYFEVFWMFNTIGWVTFYWHWKHIKLWRGNVTFRTCFIFRQ